MPAAKDASSSIRRTRKFVAQVSTRRSMTARTGPDKPAFHAEHYIFRSNPAEVEREMNAFMDALAKGGR